MRSISRAQFLRGDWSGRDYEIRPPWARPEPEFLDNCNGCGDCVSACEQKIIIISARKRARLDFSRSGCTYCGDCASACQASAFLAPQEITKAPWQQKAVIGDACLSSQGTWCMSCHEHCEYDAILAKPVPGGRIDMLVDLLACNGCGFCVSKCPVGVIKLKNACDEPIERTVAGVSA